MVYTRISEGPDDSILDGIIMDIKEMYEKAIRLGEDEQKKALAKMIKLVRDTVEKSNIREENKQKILADLKVFENSSWQKDSLTKFIVYVYNSLLKKAGLGITPKGTGK